MAVSLKHSFTSGKSDGGDGTLVQPSNWNAEHALTCATGKVLGRMTAGTGAVEEITLSAFAQSLLDDSNASTAQSTLGLVIGTNVQAYDAAISGAWTAYTPATPTAGSGSFTTVSAAGRYRQVGKTVNFIVSVTITTNGTAASYVSVALPVAAQSTAFAFKGRENAVSGNSLKCFMGSSSTILIQNEDFSYPGANGYVLAISGTYEAA